MSNSLSSIDVLILCGGLGTRLSSVIPDRPKGLAPVGGKPFLDILVDGIFVNDTSYDFKNKFLAKLGVNPSVNSESNFGKSNFGKSNFGKSNFGLTQSNFMNIAFFIILFVVFLFFLQKKST